MAIPASTGNIEQSVQSRTQALFLEHRNQIFKRTDHLFVGLMIFQWISGIIIALIVSPKTWIGAVSQTHVHVWAAIFLGGGIAAVPVAFGIFMPGKATTRYVIAVAQMLFSALLIHLTGGRIETHFHVFGSLAFLAFYRDWKVLIPATIVVALDHMLRGLFWPQSVFGVLTATSWRWVEHTAWVIFEDMFLIASCKRSVREMWDIAERTAQLEANNLSLEERVAERTHLLEHQTGRLRLLAVELTEVEQKERRRLAEVLHDHLQQFLVAAKMRLDVAERKVVDIVDKTGLTEACSYINQAISASRQLTAELRPPVLYEGGLAAGLRYLGQRMEKHHKLQIHLSTSGDVEPGNDLIKVMIYQCVQELLFNSVKYAKVTECFVAVTRLENKMIQVVVKDKGLGFRMEDLGQKEKGFGLFSIRERVKALGGEFKISSTPGQGSVFVMIVPDKVDVPEGEGTTDTSEKKIFSKSRSEKKGIVVLIADDHPIIRHSIANLLQSQTFIKEVIEAKNGEEAVQKAEATGPDIILMDINMPIMNGIEATHILCQRNSHSKVIGLSVHPEAEMAQAMKDVGAVAYFNKGDDTSSLIGTIKKFTCQEFPST